MSTLQLKRVTDPREPLELLTWRELLVLAEFHNIKEVQEGMGEELMRELLRSKGVHSCPVPPKRKIPGTVSTQLRVDLKGFRRRLEAYHKRPDNAVRDGWGDRSIQEEPPEPPEKSLSTLELARLQFQQRDDARQEGQLIDKMDFNQLRKLCSARGIKYTRKHTKAQLREILYPDGYPA
jgi:hypothetical protein